MPRILVVLLLISATTASLAQKPQSEPPELIEAREEYLQAVQRASVPFLASYLKKLEFLKERYTKEGKLDAAIAIDTELKDIEQTKASEQLTIISARHGILGTRQVTDVTDALRAALKSGQPTIKLTTFQGALGQDPAPGVEKKTKVTYYRNGLKKERTFTGEVTINFFEDLK